MNTEKILDEKLLTETLKNCDIPKPNKEDKAEALSLAMQAFDEVQAEEKLKTKENENNSENKFKGFMNNERLKGTSEEKPRKDKPLNIWRRIVDKHFRLSGTTSAVAACALLILVGGPLILNNYQKPVSSDEFAGTQIHNLTYGGTSTRGTVSAVASPEYREAVKAVEEERQKIIFKDTTQAMEDSVSRSTSLLGSLSKEEEKTVISKQAIKPITYGRKKDEAVSNRVTLSTPIPYKEIKVKKAVAIDRVSSGIMAQEMEAMPSGFISPPIVMPDDSIKPQYKDIGRDKFEDFKDSSIKIVTSEPVSTFSIDVDTASYAFMRRMINGGNLPQKDAVRVEELINYFNYNYPVPETKQQPFMPTVAVYDSPWKAGNKLIHIGIKGYDIDKTEKPKSNLVFLLDTSGSMNNADKLPLLINSMKMLVETLNPDDTVGIVTYAGSAGIALEPTKAKDKYKIISALENLRSGGSTAGAAGIRTAYDLIKRNFNKDAVNRVILATDGDFNVGITNKQELQDFVERKRKSGVFLSVLGFGQGNYNDSLMQVLAQNGNGNASYIDTLSEARKVLVDEASGTLFTIAKDVKIQVEFNPKMVAEYRLIGYETRALNREDFNNDAVDAGEVGAGQTVTAIYEITPTNVAQNRLVDDLRYGITKVKSHKLEKQTEYAYLKMRYKLPNENKSKLLNRPITINDEGAFNTMSDDIRFAASVAAFGQKLRGGKFIDDMTYDDIINIAKTAKGSDDFGYRAEFINLLRLAKSANAMQRR